MSRAKPLIGRERELVGDALRALREANGVSQTDVAEFFSIAVPVISRYEGAKMPLSATKAWDLLRSLVATEEDEQRLQSLVSAIPSLAKEVRFQELVEQAEWEGRLDDLGTSTWIAVMCGMKYQTVQKRLKRLVKRGQRG